MMAATLERNDPQSVRLMAEQIFDEWIRSGPGNESRETLIAVEFMLFLGVAKQAAASNFQSVAANGVLSAAIRCYDGFRSTNS